MRIFNIILSYPLVDIRMGIPALVDTIQAGQNDYRVPHASSTYSYFLELSIPLNEVWPHHKLWPMGCK